MKLEYIILDITNKTYLVLTFVERASITLPSDSCMTVWSLWILWDKGRFVQISPFKYNKSKAQKQACQSPVSFRFFTSKLTPRKKNQIILECLHKISELIQKKNIRYTIVCKYNRIELSE